MKKNMKMIHDASMKVLAKTGMKFHHPGAIEVLKAHGIRMEGNIAYFTEDQVMYWVKKAPSGFTLYARNPKYNVYLGDDSVNPAPPYGAPTVIEKDGTRRDGTLLDYVNFAKLIHANEDFSVNGGLMIQPNDIDIPTSCLAMFYATMTHSDKAMMVSAGNAKQMQAMIDSAAVLFGGAEELKKYPRLATLVNTISPLQIDDNMTEVLFAFAKAGQPIAVTNTAMAGSTSPVTLAGTMAMSNAEILATIALAQMVNPGTPVLYCSNATAADMRTGAFMCGTPEQAICYKYSGNMGKYYSLPTRGGGGESDAKVVNAQSGYEAMMNLMTSWQVGINLMVHSVGILDSFNSVSYEKLIQDFEIIRYIKRINRDVTFNEESFALDLIDQVGHDGEFLTQEHTFRHCRTETINALVGVRGPCDQPATQVETNIELRINSLMDSYVQPKIDDAVLAQIKDILAEQGMDRTVLDQIETM